MDGSQQAPQDLQAILASLAQYTASNSYDAQSISSVPPPPDASEALHEEGRGKPPQQAAAQTLADPRLRPPGQSTSSPKPMIDPSTITTWQEGLRCVTKIAAQNIQFADRIRRMIDDQKRNEMRWYRERQALKQSQATRSQSMAKAQSILQSLNGGTLIAQQPGKSETEHEAELADFDRKIYAAQRSMDDAMTVELKGLGVPFFGTDVNLVICDGYDVSQEQLLEGHPKWNQLVTETELLSLRRRMVGHLEDLYRD